MSHESAPAQVARVWIIMGYGARNGIAEWPVVSILPSQAKKATVTGRGPQWHRFCPMSVGIAAATKDRLNTVDTLAKPIWKSHERTCVFVTSLQMLEERDLQKSTCNWECSLVHHLWESRNLSIVWCSTEVIGMWCSVWCDISNLALHHTLHVLHVVVEHGHGDDAYEGCHLRI